MLKIRPEVEAFAQEMEIRLQANDHKGGWAHCRPEWLLSKLWEESEELETTLSQEYNPDMVAGEAADVANFAMMICDTLGILDNTILEIEKRAIRQIQNNRKNLKKRYLLRDICFLIGIGVGFCLNATIREPTSANVTGLALCIVAYLAFRWAARH